MEHDQDGMGRFGIGPTSPAYWGAVIEMQRRRIERGCEAFASRRPHPDRSSPFDGFGASFMHENGPILADVHFLLIAISPSRTLRPRHCR